jgi:hypothetical protein
MPTLIAPHFSLEELTVTQQRDKSGNIMQNVPDADQLCNLKLLANIMLEPIRTLWDCPMRVNSAFRCEAVEIKVSGKAYGQHMLGQAADIVPIARAKHLSVKAAYELIWRSNLPYDQLLLEMAGEAVWIHVSIAAAGKEPRRQALFTPDTKKWIVYDPKLVPDTGALVA